MRRECRERFPRLRFPKKARVSDPDMLHGTCVTHVPWCMSGSLTSGDGENVPGIPGACATCNFTYLVRGPCDDQATLAQVMNWCRQATSHYLRQCGPFGITRPLWANGISLSTQTLTHWDRDKMAAIFQTTFSSGFTWMAMYEFRLKCHWSLFSCVQLTNIPALVQIMAWRQPGDKPLSEPIWLVYWRLYA